VSQSSLGLRRPFAKPTKGTVWWNVEFGHNLGKVRPLVIYISHPSMLWELRACLQRSGCVAEQRRAHELEVYLPSARNEKDARRKIDVCLALWQVKNPGVEAYVMPTAEAA
jgi:hypothetical protein